MADTEFSFEFRGQRYRSAEEGLKAFADRTGRSLDNAVPILQTQIRWYLDEVVKAMESRHGQGYPGGKSDRTLNKRSGDLLKSIKDSVRVEGTTVDTVEGQIGGNVYARIQEFGGTIIPKKGKYLAIPLDAALNPDGTPKKPGPRSWSNTFVATSKAGNKIIFQRLGRKIIPLYVLKEKVYVPARLGLGDTIRAGMGLFTDRVMSAMLQSMKDAA